MKVYLIWPEAAHEYYSPKHYAQAGRTKSWLPNLALPTLAALTPADIELELCDENVSAIDFESDADVVGISGFYIHWPRMKEIAQAFRQRDKIVAIGGPFATLSEHAVRPHADILFRGEAERTWPRFLRDFQRGNYQREYVERDFIDMTESPVPDWSRLDLRNYSQGLLQTARGCPYRCEFCDVIQFVGGKVRTKNPAQIRDELEQLYQTGTRYVLLADDNLTVHKSIARRTLETLKDFNAEKREKMRFSTQLSIDLAWDEELTKLAVEAGLAVVYIGIETSNKEALGAAKKLHNVRSDLLWDVDRLQKAGLVVLAGFISGFDQDGEDVFERHYTFIQQSGIAIATPTLLVASERTPLHDRLKRENRLVGEGGKELSQQQYFSTNIVPLQMTREQMIRGQRWLMQSLYEPPAFKRRFEQLMANLPLPRPQPSQRLSSYAWGNSWYRIPSRAIKVMSSMVKLASFLLSRHRIGVAWSMLKWIFRKPQYLDIIAYHLAFFRLASEVNQRAAKHPLDNHHDPSALQSRAFTADEVN